MTTVLALSRERMRVQGVVQGVGFRPHVYALAVSLDLVGWVGNDAAGVVLEVEGLPVALDAFRSQLANALPRLASITSVEIASVPVLRSTSFVIAGSSADGAGALIPPDVAACDACLAEIADPSNRRYRYPFGNCTDCGPRFTVITGTPYDRARTTMAAFPLCADCSRERSDPTDRRFHAEPIACPACGPQLALGALRGEEALVEARRLLASGGIIAVKGLGGFHLACSADDPAAVAELRRRKGRPAKPFALLVPSVLAARSLAFVDEVEAALLESPERPIVLLRSRSDVPGIAPGLSEVGVQLPSTPLHALLLEQPGPNALVLTSGNLSEEPIAYASWPVGDLVDAVLTHDRPIQLPCDDSVLRVVGGVPTMLRRSRGFAPLPLPLSREVRPVLAVGGDLKATVCLAVGRQAWLGQHIGDLGSLEGAEALEQSALHLVSLLRQPPAVVACDAHPGYASVRLAASLAARWDVPLVRVQHHHAHIASALAEAGIDEPAIGVAFDGTGYGCDGSIWGGEVLHVADGAAVRVGHLASVLLPGGDAAVRRPARSALAFLHAAGVPWSASLAPVRHCDHLELGLVRRQLESGFGCTPTSSVGRLFDAVASLCDVRQDVSYEAQAALELEALADRDDPSGRYAFDVAGGVFDAAPVIRAIVEDLRHGTPASVVGARFTASLADVVVHVSSDAAAAAGVGVVALSGGVFANVVLGHRVRSGLSDLGLRVVTQHRVPCGDGGLSLGQAVIAGRCSPGEESSCA